MDVIVVPAIQIVISAIDLYMMVILISVVLSWLLAFNIVNGHNRFVHLVVDFAYKITEPALRPIRNVMPHTGSFDLSPVVLIFGLAFIQMMLQRLLFKFV